MITKDELDKYERFEKNVWNAAIEAAAGVIDQLNQEGPYQAIIGAREIRKLKR